MAESKIMKDLIAQSQNRRAFVKKLGFAGAALGAAAVPVSFAQPAPAIGDADILNFALNLEYLEAEFYTVATTGKTLTQSGITITGSGTGGATTGGNMVSFSDPKVQAIATELAKDEQSHVTLLQSALQGLGAKSIAKPAINLAALGIGFGSQTEFLILARAFEDIGVTAYGGAAPLIQNKAILGYAARILAVEALHSGNIRLLVAQNSIPITMLDAVDHPPPPSGNEYFPTNAMALTETRTPGQVLYLAYGNMANATAGGFFPNGVNGRLNMSSAAATAGGTALLSANPNPIPVSGGSLGSTTISFDAPGVQTVQIRLNTPDGLLLYTGPGTGSVTTGPYLTDGTIVYLQDVSSGMPLSLANTLATLVIHLQSS